jgi:hypothetical protein
MLGDFSGLIDRCEDGRSSSLTKNFDPADRMNLLTGQPPDLAAMGIRGRSVVFMHRIVKEPTGDHHALV